MNIQALGMVYHIVNKKEAEDLKMKVERLASVINKPFILNCNKFIDSVRFEGIDRDYLIDGIFVWKCLQWVALCFMANGETGNDKIIQISVEDYKWTAEKNNNPQEPEYRRMILKPEVRDSLKQQLDGMISIISNYIEEETKREKLERLQMEEEKIKLMSRVDEWNIREIPDVDEGGETFIYYHTIKIGEHIISLVERNLVNFGVVINPNYNIADGIEIGGICIKYNEKLLFWKYGSYERKLTEEEQIAYTLVDKFGKYTGAQARKPKL